VNLRRIAFGPDQIVVLVNQRVVADEMGDGNKSW
jgi:hypothetical protein